MMELEALFKLVQSWGPSAVTSLLVFFVMHLAKKLDKNGEEDRQRTENLKSYFDDQVKNLRSDITKTLDKHDRRISFIELEYVKRESFYRELGGWKTDISQVSGKLSELKDNIIDLWKNKG